MAGKKIYFKATLMNAAGLTVGGLGANALVKLVPATIDSKIVAAGQIVVGAGIKAFLGGKNKMLDSVGDGAMCMGGVSLAQQFMAKDAATAGLFDNYNGNGNYEPDNDTKSNMI